MMSINDDRDKASRYLRNGFSLNALITFFSAQEEDDKKTRRKIQEEMPGLLGIGTKSQGQVQGEVELS